MNIPAAFAQINTNFTQDPYRYVLSSYACFVLIIEWSKKYFTLNLLNLLFVIGLLIIV